MLLAYFLLSLDFLRPSRKKPLTACHIQNRIYHCYVEAIPFTLWFNRPPDYGPFRIFGCPVYAFVPANHRNKLEPHAIKAIFVGYGDSHGVKGYRLYDTLRRRFFYSKSLIFDEDALLSSPSPSTSATPA